MQYTCLTVHLANKDRSLKGSESISDRLRQVHPILNNCDLPPSNISWHVYEDMLTMIDVEYHFEEMNAEEAELKLEKILSCFEQPLRELHLKISDVSVVTHRM